MPIEKTIRIFDLLRSGFHKKERSNRLRLSTCYVLGHELFVIDGSYSQYEQYPCALGCRLVQCENPGQIGQVIVDGWRKLDAYADPISIEEKRAQMTDIAKHLGFKSAEELLSEKNCITVSEAYSQPFDEYIHVCLTKKTGSGWQTIYEGVGIEFVCKREAELIGRFTMRAVDLLNHPVTFESEVARQKTTDRKENLARRKWTKLKIEDQKPEQARQMAAHFSVGQRVRHTESGREGVVVRVDQKHHNGQGLVEAELEDGEIIKSMLILPWIEALEPSADVHNHRADFEGSPDFTEDNEIFHVGQKVAHIVSGRSGVVRKVDKDAEHGMGVIEVELDDGEVILTSCITPDLDRIA